jgi:hypothetical protein
MTMAKKNSSTENPAVNEPPSGVLSDWDKTLLELTGRMIWNGAELIEARRNCIERYSRNARRQTVEKHCSTH